MRLGFCESSVVIGKVRHVHQQTHTPPSAGPHTKKRRGRSAIGAARQGWNERRPHSACGSSNAACSSFARMPISHLFFRRGQRNALGPPRRMCRQRHARTSPTTRFRPFRGRPRLPGHHACPPGRDSVAQSGCGDSCQTDAQRRSDSHHGCRDPAPQGTLVEVIRRPFRSDTSWRRPA